MTIKTMSNVEIDDALSDNSAQVDALKIEARALTRERGNRAARGKLVASLDSAGISAEAKASILAEFDAQVEATEAEA